jgi:hypothetical protein
MAAALRMTRTINRRYHFLAFYLARELEFNSLLELCQKLGGTHHER